MKNLYKILIKNPEGNKLFANETINNTQLLFDLKSNKENESFAWNLTGDLPAQILNFDEDKSRQSNS
jgi:hypothetical protein